MNSIMQTDKECYITESTIGLHKHHVYYGRGQRQASEDNGLWVWLRWDFHVSSEHAIHEGKNKELDEHLKKLCQAKYEETHTRQEFIKLIGRSYL